MFNLMKFLKPFRWLIFVIFILLFAQAMSDLALPNYLSRIVNIGIQQRGIKNTVPDVIRMSEMKKIEMFMDEAGRTAIDQSYKLLDKKNLSQGDYDVYIRKYPGLSHEPIYLLNTENKASIEKLDSLFVRPIMVVSSVEKNGIASLDPGEKTLLPGADPFIYLEQLPREERGALVNRLMETASLPSEGMINQSAISYIASEYEVIGVKTGRIQTNYILSVGGFMMLFALLGAACSITVGFLSARIASGFARDTRRRLFGKVQEFSNIEFDKFTTASLITRTTNDIEQIQMLLVMMLRMVFYAPMMAIGAIIMVLREDVSMLWIIAAGVILIILIISVEFSVAIPRFKIIQKLVDRLNLVTREILTGLIVIRAFNSQKYQEAKFDSANKDLTKNTMFINGIMVIMMPAMMLIMNGVMLAIIWFGAHRIEQGAIQVGSMMAFMQYAMHIIMSFLIVSITLMMMPRAGVSAQRISEVIETEPAVRDPERPVKFDPDRKGHIEFQNVAFKYPGADEYVLRDISFKAGPGETIAFVGGTGSGKSTLINLIPRFYDVTEGRIFVDGADIREVAQHDLREKIGYVPQKAMLFSGTVESNIKYAHEDIAEDDIRKAAETSQSMDFIKPEENGFKAEIAQGGMNLSGGQKQRLSIARALARRPDIYIFDDSFSSLDFKTDALLRRALKEETGNSTVMIVGQRISTIMNADQIVVIDKGRVAGIGRHRILMEECGVYRELALSQLSMEELQS
jgi:ATP-binding cassette, subfamily B, multidrug efflux pump